GEAGGKCLTVRASARGPAVKFAMTLQDNSVNPATVVQLFETVPEPTSFREQKVTCKLPASVNLTEVVVYGGATDAQGGMQWLEVDYIVLELADCAGTEPTCPLG